MIEQIKDKVLFAFVFLLLGSLVSCSDPSEDIEEGIDTPSSEPYEITIGFGLTLQPDRNINIEHNYEKTGYNVMIKGDLVDGDLDLGNVDLNDPIYLEVTGPIEVTVKHPDFIKKKLGEVAYYGLDQFDVDTCDGCGLISVPLELIQGYVSVTASDIMSNFIEKVKIGKDEVELNTIYYTDETKKPIEVEVEVFDNKLEGSHENVLGEGMVYDVTFFDAIGGSNKVPSKMEFTDLVLEPERIY